MVFRLCLNYAVYNLSCTVAAFAWYCLRLCRRLYVYPMFIKYQEFDNEYPATIPLYWCCAPDRAGADCLDPAGPTSSQATAQLAAPTQAPTSAPATSLPEPTGAPPATKLPEPTSAPTVPPTAQPTPTLTRVALLPNDMPWVFRSGIIFGDDESLDFQQLGYPAPGFRFLVAPNGAYIAYISQEDRLVVIDMLSRAATTPEQRDMHIVGFSFSPDSRALAYRDANGPLQIIDLSSGQKQTIPEPQHDQQPILSPVEWTSAGLIVERLLWGSDALSQGLALIDPVSGTLTPMRERDHLRAVVSPDGRRIALVTGNLPIGAAPSAAILLLDIASGHETTIVPERQQVIKALRWSPDGSRLLYAESLEYQHPVTRLHVLNADGTNEQVLEVGGKAGGPAFSDLGWRDNATVLLLSAEGGQRLELYTLTLGSFDGAGLQPIMGIRIDPDQRLDQIVYTPQVP